MLNYAVTIKTREGDRLEILQSESDRAEEPFFVTYGELPALFKRVKQAGQKVIDRALFQKLVREGYIHANG